MPLKLDGTYGVSGVVGTASSAAVYGADADSGIVFSGNQTLINSDGSTIATVGASGINVTGIVTATSSVRIGTGASISSPATNVLTLGTNNTESVRINSSGNVGINSTSPRSILDVGGSIFAGRNDSSSEGGEIVFCKSLNNSSAWSVDVYGSTSTPSLRFIDNTAGAARMEIDGSGRVTTPYQPIFQAYGDTSQTLNTIATPVKIQFTATEDIDNGGYFDAPNSNFNVPVTGKYLVYASIMLNSNFTTYGYLFMDFARNDVRLGREIMMPRPGGGDFVSAQGSAIISASAGDTLQVYLIQSAGTAVGVRNSYRHFYGFLIG